MKYARLPQIFFLLTVLTFFTESASGAAYRIKFQDGNSEYHGTCFVCEDKIHTCLHTAVAGNPFIEVKPGVWIKTKVLYKDPNKDLALLENVGLPSLLTGEIREGDCDVFASIKGTPIAHKAGKVLHNNHKIGSFLSYIAVNANIGASGSPVIQNGKVVGMLISIIKMDGVQIGAEVVPLSAMDSNKKLAAK